MDQPSLESKLSKAIEANIAPDAIEAFVEQAPIVHTLQPMGRTILMQADIQADPEHEARLPDFETSAHVAYWKTSETPDHVKIIGLWWDEEGNAEIFHGLIGPP